MSDEPRRPQDTSTEYIGEPRSGGNADAGELTVPSSPAAPSGGESGTSAAGETEENSGESPANFPRAFDPGRIVFGDYKIIEEISRGSMGVVYQARQMSLNRVVALKVLRTGELAPERLVERFRREARALAKVSHPAIVPLYECGEEAGTHFFTMAFVDGETLKERCARGRLEILEALQIAATLADALGAAHDSGVIHRDVKPSNVMVDSNGNVRLMDFGLAKHAVDETGHTRSGTMIGTPSYMSPEQARGDSRHVDARTDIYSLGALLYEMLTGIPPFTGDSVLNIVLQVINEDPLPPRKLNPVIHPDVQTMVLKCLGKRPDTRYDSMVALGGDIRRFLRGEAIVARPPSLLVKASRWTGHRISSIAIVMLLAALAAVTASLLEYRGRQPRPTVNKQAVTPEDSPPPWEEIFTADIHGLDAVQPPAGIQNRKIRRKTGEPPGSAEFVTDVTCTLSGECSVTFDAPAGLGGLDVALGFIAAPNNADAEQLPWVAYIRSGRLEMLGPVANHPTLHAKIKTIYSLPLPEKWLDNPGSFTWTVRREGLELYVLLKSTGDAVKQGEYTEKEDVPAAASGEFTQAGDSLTIRHRAVALTNWRFKYLRACLRPAAAWMSSGILPRRMLFRQQGDPERITRLQKAAELFYLGEYNGAIPKLQAIVDEESPSLECADPLRARLFLGLAFEAEGEWERADSQYGFLEESIRALVELPDNIKPWNYPVNYTAAASFQPPPRSGLEHLDKVEPERKAVIKKLYRMYAAAAARRYVVASWQAYVKEAKIALAECYHLGGPGGFAFDFMVAGLEWTTRRNMPQFTEDCWWTVPEKERSHLPLAGRLRAVLSRKYAEQGRIDGLLRLAEKGAGDTRMLPEFKRAVRALASRSQGRAAGKKAADVLEAFKNFPEIRNALFRKGVESLVRQGSTEALSALLEALPDIVLYDDDDFPLLVREMRLKNEGIADILLEHASDQFHRGLPGARDATPVREEPSPLPLPEQPPAKHGVEGNSE